MTGSTEPTGGTGLGHRAITLQRLDKGVYAATNERGGTITIGGGGDRPDFTPVELLLVAMAGCSATDVDFITSKRAEPDSFQVECTGEKARDDCGNHMEDLTVTFAVTFPSDADGDRARDMLPKAVTMSADRLCTVSRTVQLATPVTMTVAEEE
ncbi:MAG: OsmC family protein [Nostocoides sp.]